MNRSKPDRKGQAPAPARQAAAAVARQAPYRTIFMCTLAQQTALSTGGTESDSPWDMPLALDGAGQPVLRGSTLAGALVATAETFLDVPEPVSLCGRDLPADAVARAPSVWSFWHARVLSATVDAVATQAPTTAVRVGNAVRHDTRGSASGALLYIQTLPRGTRWRFLLEVLHDVEHAGPCPALIAALALREWRRSRCWLGRKVARGMGWMNLEACEVVELPRQSNAVDAWPDATLPTVDQAWVAVRDFEPATRFLSLDAYLKQAGAAPAPRPRRAYVQWSLQLHSGAYVPPPLQAQQGSGGDASYGLDALSVGAHGASTVSAGELKMANLLRAPQQQEAAYRKGFRPKSSLALCATAVGAAGLLEPFVPGSSVAGSWRHYLSRRARAAGQAVLDPSTGERYGRRDPGATAAPDHAITALFGQVLGAAQPGIAAPGHASALLISDAHLQPGKPWAMALLDKVALSEFDQSAFNGAKYDRLAVLQGTWKLTVVQEVDVVGLDERAMRERIEQQTAEMRTVLAAGAKRRISLGGGEFRGYGHLQLQVTSCTWAPAGEDWKPWP